MLGKAKRTASSTEVNLSSGDCWEYTKIGLNSGLGIVVILLCGYSGFGDSHVSIFWLLLYCSTYALVQPQCSCHRAHGAVRYCVGPKISKRGLPPINREMVLCPVEGLLWVQIGCWNGSHPGVDRI